MAFDLALLDELNEIQKDEINKQLYVLKVKTIDDLIAFDKDFKIKEKAYKEFKGLLKEQMILRYQNQSETNVLDIDGKMSLSLNKEKVTYKLIGDISPEVRELYKNKNSGTKTLDVDGLLNWLEENGRSDVIDKFTIIEYDLDLEKMYNDGLSNVEKVVTPGNFSIKTY